VEHHFTGSIAHAGNRPSTVPAAKGVAAVYGMAKLVRTSLIGRPPGP
jgi:hypothetical protein